MPNKQFRFTINKTFFVKLTKVLIRFEINNSEYLRNIYYLHKSVL